MFTILKPTVGLHEGSCFRELLDIWGEQGYCRVVPNYDVGDPSIEETLRPQSRPWIDYMGNILLYDNTILDKLQYVQGWNKALFANEVLKADNCSNWIFWARFPKTYFGFQSKNGFRSYEERKNESVFIGNNTTSKRQGDWSNSVSFYFMGNISQNNMNNMKFNYWEYLSKLQDSKFGLCLPGVGPKCLRDVEYMGLGIVPIFTPGVSTDYYDQLKENVHYLYAKCPEDVKKVILECTNEKWNFMANSCVDWFRRNCSIQGSFETTVKILEQIK